MKDSIGNNNDLNSKESKTISIVSLSLFLALILLLFIPWIKMGGVHPVGNSATPTGGPGSLDRWISPLNFLSRTNGYLA